MRYTMDFTARIIDGKGDRTPFKATVPGCLQEDYAEAQGFTDIMYSDNYKWFGELEDSTFEYSTWIDEMPKAGKELWFVSLGIDYQYEISLDGVLLYAYEGMYRPVELNLTDKLSGHNQLTIKILPHPKREGAPADRCQADQSAKPPVCYEWDWNPRLLVSGIWQDTYLEDRDEGFIHNVAVSYDLDVQALKADVRFAIDCEKETTMAIYDREGQVVYEGKNPSFTLNNVNLWWCNGQGEQYLYTYKVTSATDEKTGTIGFRTVRLLQNRTEPQSFPKPRYDAPITVELNGRRIFAKGSNFVNPELFWGRVNEARYEELVSLAKDANMNIFRMWGGAGLRKREFYDVCDRMGIMIWQEFMLACNNYVGTPHYLEVLEREANACLDILLSHPCLTILCGGNELFNSWSGMDDQSLALRLLDKLCYERAPQIPFNKTSPMTGMAHGCYLFYDKDVMKGDVFQTFQQSNNTAYTEFGVPSMASVEDLKAVIPEDELFPPKPTKSYLAHHGFAAWGETRWICPEVLEKYFGNPDSLEQMVAESNWLQSEGYKGSFEEMRRQWPICSFGINWDFNEPWICAANNSLVAYPAKPKPSLAAVRDALRPALFSARIPHFDWRGGNRFEAGIWLLNDTNETVTDSVDVYLEIAGQKTFLLHWDASVAARKNIEGPHVVLQLPDVPANDMVLSLENANGLSSTYRLCYAPKRVEAPKRGLNGM